MIHPVNLKKLTPNLRAPQISRQPSTKHIDFFDLQNPYHAEILCQRLHDLRTGAEQEELSRNSAQAEIPGSFGSAGSSEEVQKQRSANQEIDFDLLIAKLLEIPNEELLDSILNLSA